MKPTFTIVVAIAATALLSSCATLNLPGPPGECMRNADAAGRHEGDLKLKAGWSIDRAVNYGNGVRNAARVGCAVLGVIIMRVNDKIEEGLPEGRAIEITRYRLDDLLVAGFRRNMLANPSARQDIDPDALAKQLGNQAASFARPYIPKTAADFRAYTLGWRQVIDVVESDPKIPGAKRVIALAQESMSQFWSR